MIKLFRLFIQVAVVFIGVECGLRFMGYAPFTLDLPVAPKFLRVDSVKGWAHAPGTYDLAINHWGDTMHFTINKYGARITKPESDTTGMAEKAELLLIGGSFSMGIGVNDDEAMPWHLQKRYPSVAVRNLAVGAYGTYQSLMVLEEQLKKGHKTSAVIYGWISHHRLRNVAESAWLNSLDLSARRTGIEVGLPFVTLGENGALVYQKPTTLFRVPFSENLVTCFMIERAVNKAIAYKRVNDADRITELLLLEMKALCEKNDIPFYVAVLMPEGPKESSLYSIFDRNDIDYIDCSVPLNAQNTFRDDGHPKAEVHMEWTGCIHQRLADDQVLMSDTVGL